MDPNQTSSTSPTFSTFRLRPVDEAGAGPVHAGWDAYYASSDAQRAAASSSQTYLAQPGPRTPAFSQGNATPFAHAPHLAPYPGHGYSQPPKEQPQNTHQRRRTSPSRSLEDEETPERLTELIPKPSQAKQEDIEMVEGHSTSSKPRKTSGNAPTKTDDRTASRRRGRKAGSVGYSDEEEWEDIG
ncbi:hypothetical protein D9611_007342 [Ephemerocybe angulata]|uniref:Uncharacterized protein n=1 Tax=Ephemerocybe angulata TaxID=980116 RepID=A0A8H5CG21_9AGAR|nr:hypothetical protein D9611_007342 [Tulosesus angulatus]